MNARYVLAVQNKIIILSTQNKIKHNQTKRMQHIYYQLKVFAGM